MNMTLLLRPAGLIAVCLCTVFGANPAAADAAAGERLARQWCVNCHIIGNATAGAAQQGPPNFVSIARGGITDAELRAFLSHPHGQMPDLSLTRSEIDDLVGYIDTLK